MALRFVLNGEPTHVGEADPNLTLLEWLRQSGASGTKEGCGEGECGACAVALVGRDGSGRATYTAVNSCLLPLACVDGQTLVTVEGVADGERLHPVQEALIAHGGSQCGYCTPGFVISMFCEYYRPDRSEADPEAVSGNLCRCTGYRPIVAALHSLRKPAPDDARLRTPALEPRTHGEQSARFLRPRTLSELFAQRAAAPEATLLAGGTDLMVEVNQRHRRFATLISLAAIGELRRFSLGPSELVLGAGLTLSELELSLREHAAPPLLTALWPLFSSRLVRNRATLGGNLATASPIGDAAPCLLALDARLTLASPRGQRSVALCDFFTGYRQTQCAPDELIVSVHIPLPSAPLQRFYKVSKRKLDDISTVAGAFALSLDERRVATLRVAYGGVAATPLHAGALEQLAAGRPWNRETLELLLAALEPLASPLSDQRGSAAYRKAMMGRLLEKFWLETGGAES